MFDNIPDEMKRYPQWVVWRHETINDKQTKVPYSPHGPIHASVTNPATWGTFSDATAAVAVANGALSGIGFVLTENDPYGFIDLDAWDKCPDPAETERVQREIFSRIETYTELSPSGKGLHLIVRTTDRRRGAKSSRLGLELYSQERFMTMTGDVFRPGEIADRTAEFAELWETVKQGQGDDGTEYEDEAQSKEDAVVLSQALSAKNAEKFKALHEGQWQSYYASQSEADFAYLDMLAFYSRNKEQTKRLFKASALYRSEKYDRREEHLDKEINRAFDRQTPAIDFDFHAMKLEEQRKALAERKGAAGFEPTAPALEPGKAQSAKHPKDATPISAAIPYSVKSFPPGLLGEICDFIYRASPRPVREVALVSALGLMAGVIGRAYNVSGTGLNQYLMLVAKTGTGKEACNAGISRLMKAVVGNIDNGVASARTFIGPGEIRSDAALLKYLSKHPCFVSVAGEFGLRLKTMAAANATSSEKGLKRLLLDLYGKSGHGNMVNPTIYSDKEKNIDPIQSPAFTLIGESTPERFYEGLDETMIAEGLIPRFTVIEYKGDRPKLNKSHITYSPSYSLVEKVRALATHSLELMQKGQAHTVRLDQQAQDMFDAFNESCDDMMRGDGADEVTRQLWNRAHLKALKLAALLAVGIDPYDPAVTVDIGEWAIGLVEQDVQAILGRFERGETGEGAIGQGQAAQINLMQKVIGGWLAGDGLNEKYGTPNSMIERGLVLHASINKRFVAQAAFRHDRRSASAAIKDTINVLIENGAMVKLSPAETLAKCGTSGSAYVVTNLDEFRC